MKSSNKDGKTLKMKEGLIDAYYCRRAEFRMVNSISLDRKFRSDFLIVTCTNRSLYLTKNTQIAFPNIDPLSISKVSTKRRTLKEILIIDL